MYDVIFFDLDNTLIDFTSAEAKSLAQINIEFYQTEHHNFVKRFKEINDRLWMLLESSEAAADEKITTTAITFGRFEELNKIFDCCDDYRIVATRYAELLGDNTAWLHNAEIMLNFLSSQGYNLGIVTNGISSVQRKKYERHKLDRWMKCLVISDEVGSAKPSEKIFQYALSEINRNRNVIGLQSDNKILMVGDSLTSDGLGAKRCGFDFCLVGNFQYQNTTDIPIHYGIQYVADLPYVLGYDQQYSDFLNQA